MSPVAAASHATAPAAPESRTHNPLVDAYAKVVQFSSRSRLIGDQFLMDHYRTLRRMGHTHLVVEGLSAHGEHASRAAFAILREASSSLTHAEKDLLAKVVTGLDNRSDSSPSRCAPRLAARLLAFAPGTDGRDETRLMTLLEAPFGKKVLLEVVREQPFGLTNCIGGVLSKAALGGKVPEAVEAIRDHGDLAIKKSFLGNLFRKRDSKDLAVLDPQVQFFLRDHPSDEGKAALLEVAKDSIMSMDESSEEARVLAIRMLAEDTEGLLMWTSTVVGLFDRKELGSKTRRTLLDLANTYAQHRAVPTAQRESLTQSLVRWAHSLELSNEEVGMTEDLFRFLGDHSTGGERNLKPILEAALGGWIEGSIFISPLSQSPVLMRSASAYLQELIGRDLDARTHVQRLARRCQSDFERNGATMPPFLLS